MEYVLRAMNIYNGHLDFGFSVSTFFHGITHLLPRFFRGGQWP